VVKAAGLRLELMSNGQNPRPRVFTPDQIAERWGVSANTVRALIKSGKLRGFRLGRLFRVPAEAVEEFEKGSAVEGGGPSELPEPPQRQPSA
jgi:excisionase family DNA binding protein